MGEYFKIMSINLKNFKKCFNCFAAVIFMLITALPSIAEENIISSVIISKAKNKPNSYELSIDSSKTVDYKTEFDEDGNIYFDLKNSILSDEAGTVYDDAADIDNVVVKQMDKNKVRIYVAGKNAKNTELVFINSLFDTKQQTKKIVINRPVSEYKSTTGYNEDLESQDEVQEWNDNSFNLYHFVSETLSGAKESAIGIVLIIVSLLIFVLITIRTITSKISQDQEPLIGLNNTKNTAPEDLIQTKLPKIQQREINYNDIADRSEVLKNAQKELERAHNKYQEYLQNKYKNTGVKPKTVDANALLKSMALNQYKKNEKNPYLDQEVIKMDTVNQFRANNQGLIPPRPKKPENNFTTMPYIQKPASKIKFTPKTTSEDNSGSLKFLESVSKIYEQSGREDLALGLKKSITKSTQKV